MQLKHKHSKIIFPGVLDFFDVDASEPQTSLE